jgi:hypothetical protein
MSRSSFAFHGHEDKDRMRALIRRRYRQDAESRYQQLGKPRITIGALRLYEIERVFADRFGGRAFPNTVAGKEALRIAAEQVVLLNTATVAVGWLRSVAPWVEEPAALVAAVSHSARRLSADELAWRIGLRWADRQRLKIRTIGAVDCNAIQRKARRKAADRASKEARRRAAGAKPRADYEAESLAQIKPWAFFGWSRATWYRRGCPQPSTRETGPSAVESQKESIAPAPVSWGHTPSPRPVPRAPSGAAHRELPRVQAPAGAFGPPASHVPARFIDFEEYIDAIHR